MAARKPKTIGGRPAPRVVPKSKPAERSVSRASAARRTVAPRPVRELLREALAGLERKSTAHDRQNLARFGITARHAYGVSMANLKVQAKLMGRNHELALALWKTDRYEARMLATLVDDPAQVTRAQMDGWCRDFDNWAICDTACFCLFDRSPHAWEQVTAWSRNRDEFGKRAAFALLASLALHDKRSPDKPFLAGLRLIEAAAPDERNFVKKGVNWALRAVGLRNRALHAAALATARRLADSMNATSRWVGKGALRELSAAKKLRGLGS